MSEQTIVLEIVIVSSEDGHSVILRSGDQIFGRSPIFEDRDTAMMLAREMEKRARQIAEDFYARQTENVYCPTFPSPSDGTATKEPK